MYDKCCAKIRFLFNYNVIKYNDLTLFKRDLNYYLNRYGTDIQIFTFDPKFQNSANEMLLNYFAINS